MLYNWFINKSIKLWNVIILILKCNNCLIFFFRKKYYLPYAKLIIFFSLIMHIMNNIDFLFPQHTSFVTSQTINFFFAKFCLPLVNECYRLIRSKFYGFIYNQKIVFLFIYFKFHNYWK